MLKSIRNSKTDELIEVVEDIPICGKDFCDTCGDCLYCYGETECVHEGGHYWVEYTEVNTRKELL